MKDENFVKSLLELYEKGLSDKEIGVLLNVKEGTIFWWRHRKLHLTANKKVNLDKHKSYIISAINSKVSIKQICAKLNCSLGSLRSFIKNIGYSDLRHLRNNEYKVGPREMSILVGTLMGDASIESGKKSKYSRIYLRHCIRQKTYTEYLYSNLLDLKPKIHIVNIKESILDDRLIKAQKQIELALPSNKYYDVLSSNFYINGKKAIPFNLLYKYYNREALAIHFMDDGSKNIDRNTGEINGFVLSTNCFTYDELQLFCGFLLGKFGIHCNVQKPSNTIRIQARSVKRFLFLVSPYITEDLKYKISSNKIS